MRIVVFGAGGFVGGWICEELSQREGVEVIACVRRWASAVRVARRGMEIRQVDLEDSGALAAVLAGADAVINAAMLPPSREPDLVAALYLASAQAGVRRFVQFSSGAVYGARTGVVHEEMPPTPGDDYGRGKAVMEERLVQAWAGADLLLFILRPSIIYGPFSGAWTVRYVERVVKGGWRSLGRIGEGTCNLVHGHDTARAAIAAATAPVAPGQYTLNLNGPDVVTWNEYIERLGDALGVPDRTVPSALALRTMAAASAALRTAASIPFVKAFYRRSGGSARAAMKAAKEVTSLYPSAGELSLLSRRVRYSADRAGGILRFTPATSLDEGLRQSVAWCRVHGIV